MKVVLWIQISHVMYHRVGCGEDLDRNIIKVNYLIISAAPTYATHNIPACHASKLSGRENSITFVGVHTLLMSISFRRNTNLINTR